MVYIVDKRVSMGEAMSMSKALVSKVGIGMHLVMVLLMGFVSALLSLTYIGNIFAMPFFVVVICVMYFIFNNEEHLLLPKTSGSYSEVQAGPYNISSDQAINRTYQSYNINQGAGVISSPTEPKHLESVGQVSIVLMCVNCGSKASGGSFCTECGSPLVSVCAKCKKELVKGARFCPSCGSKLG